MTGATPRLEGSRFARACVVTPHYLVTVPGAVDAWFALLERSAGA